MTESATKQVERLVTAIREMQGQGMKVNKNRLSKYMNEEKGDNISIVTVGKYFDQAIKQVNGSSSKASTSPSTNTAGDKGRSELLCWTHENMCFSPIISYDELADETKKKLEAWAALGEKELIDQLCLALEFEWEAIEGTLDFPERFKKIELVGFERPTAARIESDWVECDFLSLVYRVEYSDEYLDEIDGLDEEEREESLEETRWDLYRILYPTINLGGEDFDGRILTLQRVHNNDVEVINALSQDTGFFAFDSGRETAINAATLPPSTVVHPVIWEAD